MKNLVRFTLVATAMIAMTSMAFAQAPPTVVVKPSQLPVNAETNTISGDHQFIQVFEVTMDNAVGGGDDISIVFPAEVTPALMDADTDPTDEIYVLADMGLGGGFVVTGITWTLGTRTLGFDLTALAAADVAVLIVPVITSGTAAADIGYSITVQGNATPATPTVSTIDGALSVMNFDDDLVDGLVDLATVGSMSVNPLGKFHPNQPANQPNFLSAASLNLIDEVHGLGNSSVVKPANDWIPTTAGFGDADVAADEDNDGEVTYKVWASTTRSLTRMDLGAGAIPISDYLTGDGVVIFDGLALAAVLDLQTISSDGYWFFYLTSSLTAEWALASSDSVLIKHGPALIDPITGLVATGVGFNVPSTPGSGRGLGIDYDADGLFENTAGANDDVTAMTLDGGEVLKPTGDLSGGDAATDNVNVFWYMEDINSNARMQIFVARDDATLTADSVVIAGDSATAIGSFSTEITTSGQFEEDVINFKNLSVVSPAVLQANTLNYIYAVMYDGSNITVELLRNVDTGADEVPMVLEVRHHPYIQFHDLFVALAVPDDQTWDTSVDQFYPISWGEQLTFEKDPDASPGATIILYAVDEAQLTWAGAGVPDAVITGGTVIAPNITLASRVGTGATVITTIIDSADTREDNRYMWDIRNSGLAEGTYSIWATIGDGADLLTMQLTSTPADFAGGAAEDRSFILEHNSNFLANNPFEGERVELSQDDIYEFSWADASSGNSSTGKVKMLLVPETTTTLGIDYLTTTNLGTDGVSSVVFTPNTDYTEQHDVNSGTSDYSGTVEAVYVVTMDAAATFAWSKDGVDVAAGVAIGANAALSDGVVITHITGGGYTVGSSFTMFAYPKAANAKDNYWIIPTLDGTAGLDGDVHGANSVGFTASTNKAQLTVDFLKDDHGTGNVTPAAAAIASGFKYYDVYYWYANDGTFDGLEAITYTDNVGSANTIDDIIVAGNYSGADPHTYNIFVDTEAGADLYTLEIDGDVAFTGQAMNPATPFDIGNGITIDWGIVTGHGANDAWTFRVEGHFPTKADGQLYFNGDGGLNLNYRVISSSIAAQAGDTLDFTLQTTYHSSQRIALLNVFMDIPTDNMNLVGAADSALTPVTASGFVQFTNTLTTNGSVQEVNYEAYVTGGKFWDGGGDYAVSEWVDIATFKVAVTGSYTGSGLDHNFMTFSQSGSRITAMSDDNLDQLAMLINTNAADVQLFRLGSLAGSVELEGRDEAGETVSIFLSPSGSFDAITDAAFLAANSDADGTDGVTVTLGVGGTYSVTDVPTGKYDVVISKRGFLSQKQAGVTIQPTSVSSVNFENADKMLGGDVAGYLDTDGKSYPDNQIFTEDEAKVVSLLGTSPATTPESYSDVDGSGTVDIADLTIVVKNASGAGKSGEGILYKEESFDGNNDAALVWLGSRPAGGDEFVYTLSAKDMSNLRGFSAGLEINPEDWEIVSFESGLSNFGGSRDFMSVSGFKANFYSASKLWSATRTSEMDLLSITLRALVSEPQTPTLAQVTLVDNDFTATEAVIDALAGLPSKFSLDQNFPNPFNPATTIQFSLPTAGNVRLVVYNLLGQEVRMLRASTMEAGTYKAIWNSNDNLGRKVSSGLYLYRLTVDNKVVATKKMIMLK